MKWIPVFVFCLLLVSEQGSARLSDFGGRSNANELNDREIFTILRAGSSRELEKNVNSLTVLRKSRAKCLAQLRVGRVPGDCFDVLVMEWESGLISRPTKMNQEKWLIDVCMNRVETSADLTELALLEFENHIPEACRSSARRRLADLEYAAELSDPARRFELRMRFRGVKSKVGPNIE
jgi:hypothetical protein